jgi:hypothetical protein
MKIALAATVVVGIWSAPIAYADTQDQAFLSFLAAHNVAVDRNVAIKAVHIACAQIADRQSDDTIATVLREQVPGINGAEYWVTSGARTAYCPPKAG